jgi:O-antigen ligase
MLEDLLDLDNMKKLLIISAIALVACLLPLPYGFFTLIRFSMMVIFAVLAYNFNQQKNNTLAITFSALALLFQPFLKITLGRTVWNVVDVVLALFLLFLFFRNKQ